MKLLVTYKDGKAETHIGVESIKPIKDAKGHTTGIQVETFLRYPKLEKPPEHHYNGIVKMEVFF